MNRWQAIGLQLFEEERADRTLSTKARRRREQPQPSPERKLVDALIACADGDPIPLIEQARKGFRNGGLPALPRARCAELVSVLRFKQKPGRRRPDMVARIALWRAQDFDTRWVALLKCEGIPTRGIRELMRDESCRYAIRLFAMHDGCDAPSSNTVRDLMRRSRTRQSTTSPRRTSAK